ncbi:hypothetical protein ACIQKB_36970 [Streptomyces sp. NPDC092046]|uniref:hypothetical protein n=1 Tax=Streptomyces sp. NPDC092046 TaxID=3366009 RepID=UPI0037FCD3C4
MSTTTLFVLLLLAVAGLAVVAAPAYLVWRHPRLAVPLTVAAAFGALVLTAVFGIAAR